jgi:CRISPR-associated protein Csm1
MSFQIFLQGKILGIEEFLVDGGAVEGRAVWASLLSEVLPRALLAELGLSPMLLGLSGGSHFLVLIPAETRGQADDFCRSANAAIAAESGGTLRLVWAGTENLGDWSDIRKRLNDQLQDAIGSPLAEAAAFDAFVAATGEEPFEQLASAVRHAERVGWSPESPAGIVVDGGKHSWPIGTGIEAIPLARHAAPGKDDASVATPRVLGSRASGRKTWGVLRGDIDNSTMRLRRAQNVEEYLQLGLMYKQFLASELQMRCSLPEFWRKVTLISTGADDFIVYGAWDALVGFAREVQRIFSAFVDTNLKDYTGLEGKTISMAIALARNENATLQGVLADAVAKVEIAKTSGKDCIYLFGRTLEWKQLADAADTHQTMTRLIREFGASPQLLYELAGFYAEAEQSATGVVSTRLRHDRVDRPWRFHRRLNALMPSSRNREFQRLRTDLIEDFTGRRARQIRLRPQGRVALEWARLETERNK